MHAKVVLQLIGSMDHLRLVWQAGEALLESVVFEEDCEGTRYNVLLALQEMVTNVLRHGYKLDESKPIEIEFEVTADDFLVELRDQGPEFDPLEVSALDGQGDEDMPMEAGGFGIHITRMVMDQVTYERRGEWNCLRLRKGVAVKAGI
ncbi:MAG: ATP-binding protein [Planctomycetes bacterium]|nr:ATP-binding protein [Planctomycetota bacterium]